MPVYFVDQQWLGKETMEIQRKAFESAGMRINFMKWQKPSEIIAGAQDADALMVVAVPISKEVIEALPDLKFIGRCGIGYDSVDLQAATDRGVVVCNVPDYCGYEVASHSITLMLALKRNLMPFIARAQDGGYGQGNENICYRIQGQTLGLIGYGRIAREMAVMARGLGMKILVYDPYVKETRDEGVTLCDDLDIVLKFADAVSVHTPLTEQTKHLLTREQFRLMKKDAVIINTARGGVIKTEDLLEALNQGIIAGAGLDVCEGEPLPADHPVFKTKNLIYTPHVAMYSEDAMIDLHQKLTKQALDVLNDRWTNNIVNPLVKEKREWKIYI